MIAFSALGRSILIECLITLPFHLFAYVPFWSYKRLPTFWMVVLLAWTHLTYISLYSLLLYAELPLKNCRIIAIPIYAIPFFLSVNIEWGKILFLYVFTMDYMMVTRGCAVYLEQLFFGPSDSYLSWQFLCFCLALVFLTLPFMLKYFCLTAKNIFEIHAPQLWKRIWLLPVFTSALVFAYTFPSLDNDVRLLLPLSRLVLLVCMFLIYYYITQTVNQFRRQLETEERIHHLEQLTSIQADQYGLLLSRIEETRRARHDLRQHLRVIQGCIASRDFDSLSEYVKILDERLPALVSHSWSGNPAVDAVLSFYAQKAADADIDIEILFLTGPEPLIPEPELCILLGNLLENALDACSAALPGQVGIRVCARKINQKILSITVDNTSPAPPAGEQGVLLSSKHPGTGIGTESIRIIAERYNGDARFEWKDGVFYSSVMLNP